MESILEAELKLLVAMTAEERETLAAIMEQAVKECTTLAWALRAGNTPRIVDSWGVLSSLTSSVDDLIGVVTDRTVEPRASTTPPPYLREEAIAALAAPAPEREESRDLYLPLDSKGLRHAFRVPPGKEPQRVSLEFSCLIPQLAAGASLKSLVIYVHLRGAPSNACIFMDADTLLVDEAPSPLKGPLSVMPSFRRDANGKGFTGYSSFSCNLAHMKAGAKVTAFASLVQDRYTKTAIEGWASAAVVLGLRSPADSLHAIAAGSSAEIADQVEDR